MELKEARYILAIARHQSIGKAAESLYISQPSLSKYLKNLEKLMQKKAKVALDEGYIFGEEGRGFERINVASPRSVIEECMNRIRTAFEEEKLV